jgi:hypothetical protein
MKQIDSISAPRETLYSLAMKIFFAEKDSHNLKLINEAKEQFDREEKFKKFFSTRKIY